MIKKVEDTIEVQNKLATTPFGNGEEIKILANRLEITSVIPGAQKLTKQESLLLAQIAIAHRLDPFNGEVWLIKSEKTGKMLGVMIGIKGLRKKARQQIERKRDGAYWITYRDLEGDERDKYFNTPDKYSIVIESTLTDTETAGAWLLLYAKMKNAKMDDADIKKHIGEMPCVKGLGIYTPKPGYSDNSEDDSNGDYKKKTKMHPVLIARKRAEADALKQRFDVPFGLEYTENLDELPAEIESPADEPFDNVVEGVIIEGNPFVGRGRPFSAPDLLNAINALADLLPADTTIEKEEAEIVQKAILNGIGGKVDIYGKISKYLTNCAAIPAAPATIIKAIQHWSNPTNNPNGNTAYVSGMAQGELSILVDYLKDK